MENTQNLRLSKKEDQSIVMNISLVELDSQYEIPNFLTRNAHMSIPDSEKQPYPKKNTSISPSTQSTSNSISQLSEDLSLLKQMVTNIVTEINNKSKESQKKKELIKALGAKCHKNKKKISKIKKNIQFHEDKIIEIESYLTNKSLSPRIMERSSLGASPGSKITSKPSPTSSNIVNLTLSTRSNASNYLKRRPSLKLKVLK